MSDIGNFYSEHRKLIDSRKAHLARVGVNAPGVAPIKDTMPSQADVLRMPTTQDAPMLDKTHAPKMVEAAPGDYKQPKLPKLLGVNETLQD
jgi:hypothetical protein